MKKLIPVLALAAGAAAFVAYKMKKDEKKIVELDEGLLYDEDDDSVEEALISNPQLQVEDTMKQEEKECEECKEAFTILDETYPHLSTEKVNEVKKNYENVLEKLTLEGDVHENERPIEHFVTFQDEQKLEEFRQAVVNRGFVISSKEQDSNTLNILHISAVNNPKLLDNVLFLADMAAFYDGVYNGWKTKVVY